MKHTFLCLHPDTFFFKGKHKLLLYNSESHQYLEAENDAALEDVQNRLLQLENAYCIPINEPLFTQYKYLWEEIENRKLGILLQSTWQERPVSYPPVLKMNQNINTIRYDYKEKQAGYILEYLYEVTVYLSGNESVRDEYYKQTLYPLPHKGKLSPEQLLEWFSRTKGGALRTVNFIGDPIILSEYKDVFNFLRKSEIYINYYILWDDFFPVRDTKLIPADFNTVILYKGDTFDKVDPAYDAKCLITDNEEIYRVKRILSALPDRGKSVELVPVYTGKNLNFFRECIYTDKEELLSSELSKQDIFTRMELNTNYFGKLTILPDGSIYSNLNTPSLGGLNDSLYEIIYKELNAGGNWRCVRNFEPCNQCRFRWLCPPISNYEFILDKYNLCSVPEKER